jgi:hypothetical protein
VKPLILVDFCERDIEKVARVVEGIHTSLVHIAITRQRTRSKYGVKTLHSAMVGYIEGGKARHERPATIVVSEI